MARMFYPPKLGPSNNKKATPGSEKKQQGTKKPTQRPEKPAKPGQDN